MNVSSENPLHKRLIKDTELVENIKPEFDKLIDPTTIIKHINVLVSNRDPLPHKSILNQLLEQIEPLDFQSLAFDQVNELRKRAERLKPESSELKEILKQIEGYKVSEKHYLVLSIENILKIAKQNRWGLCRNQDFIYLYNGAYWTIIEKEELQCFLGKASEQMGVPKFSSRLFLFTDKLLKQFMLAAYLPSPDLKMDSVNINLLNGTFEIHTEGNKLRPFDPNDFITYQLPFEYNLNKQAPLFQSYLDRVLPDLESQKVLAEYLGYIFLRNGAFKLEKALILYGTGANGKSVFFEIVNALLGKENTSSYPLDLLTDSNGYYRAKIGNKLVNYASEIGGHLKTDSFKQMVSGEPISARLPYGTPMTLNQYAKFIFNCNELPRDIEQSNAYFRRFLIIPFDVTIPEQQQDKELHKKIIDNELSGVFNWVLGGLKRLLEQRNFTYCRAANAALEQYRTQSDSVKLFIDEKNLHPSPNNYKTTKDLYFDYRIFCNEDGFRAVNKTHFNKRLKSMGVNIERRNLGYVAYLEEKTDFL
jgi:putative DNA primase/helicase